MGDAMAERGGLVRPPGSVGEVTADVVGEAFAP